MREITWKEHFMKWSWLYVYVVILWLVLSAFTLPVIKVGGTVVVFSTLVVGVVLWRLIVAHKKSIKIHSCGKVWYLSDCPNCGNVCCYCGKKADE